MQRRAAQAKREGLKTWYQLTKQKEFRKHGTSN
jgi:hypothetical protein